MNEEELSAIEARTNTATGLGHEYRNAAFIAHARQDIPALIAEVRRLQGEVKELEATKQVFIRKLAEYHTGTHTPPDLLEVEYNLGWELERKALLQKELRNEPR